MKHVNSVTADAVLVVCECVCGISAGSVTQPTAPGYLLIYMMWAINTL